MNLLSTALTLTSLVTAAHATLVEKVVTYQQGGVTLEGYHVYDDAVTGKRPGILVIHQWTGLGDNEKFRSRMLAELGYNVFAADVYGQGVRPQVPAAGVEAGKYKTDRSLYRARLLAALDQLKTDEHTNAKKLAAIGYCFGGTGALELARAGTALSGVVSFHGGLSSAPGMAATAGNIPAKLLVLHGAADPYVPAEELAAFRQEMLTAKAALKVVTFKDAVHAFTQKEAGSDPSTGAAYQEAADQASWAAMQEFFKELFN